MYSKRISFGLVSLVLLFLVLDLSLFGLRPSTTEPCRDCYPGWWHMPCVPGGYCYTIELSRCDTFCRHNGSSCVGILLLGYPDPYCEDGCMCRSQWEWHCASGLIGGGWCSDFNDSTYDGCGMEIK
jgi:hypothetical protein